MAIFFIVIFIIVLISSLLVICSTLRINIIELEIVNRKVIKFKLIFSLNIFNKISWLKLRIDNKRLEGISDSFKATIINKILNTKIVQKYKNIQNVLTKDSKKIFKVINQIKIEKFNATAKISTENAAQAAIITGIISVVISILLAKKVPRPYYLIEPIYLNKNYIYLSTNCIISIKVVHIINVRKELKRKEVYQKYGRTSNRRTYANSNG